MDYGLVLKSYVLNWRPSSLVALGVSNKHNITGIEEGIKEANFLYAMEMKLISYDLSKIELEKIQDDFTNESIEFLYVDANNTKEVLKKIIELWTPKIRGRGLILFDGGSEERDSELKKEIETSPMIKENYFFGTYYPFPSMTVFLRKW